MVNVTLIEESYEQICTRLNISKKGKKTRRWWTFYSCVS
jgi:hypothetical protein